MNLFLDSPLNALKEYVACASVSADSNFHEGLVAAQNFAQAGLRQLGFEVDLIETPGIQLFWVHEEILPGLD